MRLRKPSPIPVIALSEPERILRRFVQAATDAIKANNGTSLQVDTETLKELLFVAKFTLKQMEANKSESSIAARDWLIARYGDRVFRMRGEDQAIEDKEHDG